MYTIYYIFIYQYQNHINIYLYNFVYIYVYVYIYVCICIYLYIHHALQTFQFSCSQSLARSSPFSAFEVDYPTTDSHTVPVLRPFQPGESTSLEVHHQMITLFFC